MKVEIDTTACTGHGRCYEVAPGLFAADPESGYGEVTGAGEVGPSEVDAARRAVAVCPEAAIVVAEVPTPTREVER
jgi:ferredoxin